MTDNITPIHPEPSKPRTALQFADDDSSTAVRAFMGLKGVCAALYALDGTADSLEDYVQLSIAASVLVDILEELQQ